MRRRGAQGGDAPRSLVEAWFAARGWSPFAFQREVWAHIERGASGLLHASTGAGKTHAVWFGVLHRALAAREVHGESAAPRREAPPLSVLWITPMRALAADTRAALEEPLAELGLDWPVGLRTGDTGSAERARQSRRLPTALVTTPESLSVLLSQSDAAQRLGSVQMVVVDEWHELLGSKRGVQLQLALARLRRWCPALQVWGLSATLGNLREAMEVLTGANGVLVEAQVPRALQVDTLLPETVERFPWAGHLGLRLRDAVVAEIDASPSSLVFTNTRSQAELWYSALLDARPDWAGLIALHHGSIDPEARQWVEQGLKAGRLKSVVCTSSLDLGVDFSPVERVLQIGSAKGVARLLQRAGRSGHGPGRVSRITLVPTHSLELLEAAAVRDAVRARVVESRGSPRAPLDVLVQHLVTVALGGGFRPADLLAEVRTCAAYRDLTDAQFDWALAFVTRGGRSLAAYPEHHRVVPDEHGVHRVPDRRIARRHRLSIGTIVSEASVTVKYLSGGRIGNVEEGFVGRLKPGDRFLFAGRTLELVRVHEMTAWVRRATGSQGAVPRWNGGRLPLSGELADHALQRLAAFDRGVCEGPEMQALRPLLELQARWSDLPGPQRLLIETLRSREGHHVFVYPFAGRQVHSGLAALLAWRLAREASGTFSIAVNDYGFELMGAEPCAPEELLGETLWASEGLVDDVRASLNAGELARRRFREIARVSGLIQNGALGERRSARQLQASASLFFEVFRKHDQDNLLLRQADDEVLQQELESARLIECLRRLQSVERVHRPLKKPSPFAFPLMVERFRERLSAATLSQRIERMVRQLEAAARP